MTLKQYLLGSAFILNYVCNIRNQINFLLLIYTILIIKNVLRMFPCSMHNLLENILSISSALNTKHH